MKRVLVIGSGGAGKSTLAWRLAERAGLPLIHLDALYWSPGWQATQKPEWEHTVEQLVRQDAWVMDGNYGGTLDRRLEASAHAGDAGSAIARSRSSPAGAPDP